MRAIDADALMKEFAEFVAPSNRSDFEPIPTWNDAVSLLGSAPTLDVVPTDYHDKCMKVEIEKRMALEEFAEWITEWVFKDSFEEESGAFAELACRRLARLGYVVKEGENWLMREVEE